MGGRGGSMGGSHGMGGGGAAPKAAPQTREQQLLAQIKNNPAALMRMSDQDALDTVKAIEQQPIATDGTQNDTFVQRWLNATGLANETPTVLDDAAFERARKKEGAQTLYHSDMPSNGSGWASAYKTQQQLQTGNTAFASRGLMGSGTYLDTNAAENARDYGTGGAQVKLFINKSAKVASRNEVWRANDSFKAAHPKTYEYLTGVSISKKQGRHGSNNMNTIWATVSGYNACDLGNGYRVAYSRKALTICKNIRNASTITRNW